MTWNPPPPPSASLRAAPRSWSRGHRGAVAALAAMGIACGAGAWLFTFIVSDAATRLDDDIRAGVSKLGSAPGDEYEVEHRPRAWFDGCTGGYAVDIGRGSAKMPDKRGIGVTCAGGRTGYGTTHHLNYVDVPVGLRAEHAAGESTFVRLRRRADGFVEVVGLR